MAKLEQKVHKAIVLALSLVLIMTILLTGCGQTGSKGKYKAGTYTAQAQGNNGLVKVEVTVSDSAITAVKVVEHSETVGIGDIALDRIAKSIVDKQTLKIDTVSGATNSSRAILAAVEDCITQAGGDVTELKEK